QRAEALVECHLIGGKRAVGSGNELACQINVPRSVGGQAVILAGAFLEAGARECGADDRLVPPWGPRQPEARQEIGNTVVLVVEGAAVAILTRQLNLTAVHAEIRHAVMHFVNRGEYLPA